MPKAHPPKRFGVFHLQFYKHHIGDYMKDTAHLSLVEEGIYRRLLDWYYANERPLPSDFERICRLVRAEESEKKHVRDVLNEFFIAGNDGYRNARCDRELEAWYAKSGKAKESAEKRWNANAMRTHSERNANGMLPTTHYPLPINKEITTLLGKPNVAPSKSSENRETAHRLIDFLNAKTGKAFTYATANTDLIISRLKEGHSEQDCKTLIARKCKDWGADDKMRQYLRPATLFNRTKFHQYIGECVELP